MGRKVKKKLSYIILYFDNLMDLFKNKNGFELKKKIITIGKFKNKDDNNLDIKSYFGKENFKQKNFIGGQKYNETELKVCCSDFLFKKQ